MAVLRTLAVSAVFTAAILSQTVMTETTERPFNDTQSSNITRRLRRRPNCSPFVPGFLLVVGVIENCFSIFVLSRKGLKQLPLRASLIVLCTASLLTLAIAMPRFIGICLHFGDIRRRFGIHFCKFHRFMVNVVLQLTNTTVAFISLERFMAIMFPFMIPQSRVTVERSGLLIIVLFCVVFNLHNFFTIQAFQIVQEPPSSNGTHLLVVSNSTRVVNTCHVTKLYSLKTKRGRSSTVSRPSQMSSIENEPQVEMALIETANGNDVTKPVAVTPEDSPPASTSPMTKTKGCRSREAQAAQLILIITVSFIICNAPFEIYNALVVFPRMKANVSLWTFFLYVEYSYQLLVFPIYIVYHPIIRSQLSAWCVGVKQRVSMSRNDDNMNTFERQKSSPQPQGQSARQ